MRPDRSTIRLGGVPERFVIAHVELEGVRLAPRAANFRGHLARGLMLPIREHDLRAPARELDAEGPPDTRCAARDECDARPEDFSHRANVSPARGQSAVNRKREESCPASFRALREALRPGFQSCATVKALNPIDGHFLRKPPRRDTRDATTKWSPPH